MDLFRLVFIKGTVPFFYFLLFIESFALYVVSAREELFALPGAAEGGRIALLAAESGPPEAVVVSLFLGIALLLLL